MKNTRRRYDSRFKISVVAKLEAGKPLAQNACEHGAHPILPSRWRDELAENPEKSIQRQWQTVQGRGPDRRAQRGFQAKLMLRMSF